MALAITSAAFTHNGAIPKRYTCEGADVSPPLSWSGEPAGTKSFALIVDDPDAPDPSAPKTTWVHLLVFNMRAEASAIAEDRTEHGLPSGAREGINDWNRVEYGGPCPPIGRHRYFHKLYALDTMLADITRPTKTQLLHAMQGHVLGEAQLVCTYQKGR